MNDATYTSFVNPVSGVIRPRTRAASGPGVLTGTSSEGPGMFRAGADGDDGAAGGVSATPAAIRQT